MATNKRTKSRLKVQGQGSLDTSKQTTRDPMQSIYEKGCDDMKDESDATDICAYCANYDKLQPALYVCLNCSPYGRFMCGDCNKHHKKFGLKHDVKDLSAPVEGMRKNQDIWQIEMDKVVQERDQALAESKERNLELEREKGKNSEHLNLIQQSKSDADKLENKIKQIQDELLLKKAQYDKVVQDNRQVTTELAYYKTRWQSEMKKVVQERVQALAESKEVNLELEREKGKNTEHLNLLQQSNRQVTTELAEYKTRLSKRMGSGLSDINPNIADLSDRNRPTKLSERYQELYDNEWTDAFEVFETHYKNESKTIKSLKLVFEHVKQICDELSQDQSKMLIESLTMKKTQGGSVSKDIMKQLRDLRRSSAESSFEGVLEQYIKQVDELRASGNELANLILNEGIRPFIRGCVQLCWLMTVQDPPLHFGPDPDSSHPIDTNIYKFYTKTGTCIDYVVLPPLFLHKDGPLLWKGIAQGHTPASEKLPEGDRLLARERRREHVSSTVGRTTYNSSSRQTAYPPPHNDSSPGQSKVKDNTSEKGYRHEQSEASSKIITGDEKGADGKSTSNGNKTDKRYSAQSQTPTLEEWRIFVHYAQIYSLDSSEIKAALGDRYQVCLDHYFRRIQQRRSNQTTNI